MSEPYAGQDGGVLAAPQRRSRRLTLAAIAGVALALALAATGGVIILTARPSPVSLAGTLTAPRGSSGASSAAFSPDGKTLAILDGNGSTQIRNAATGRLIATLTSPQCRGGGAQVVFSPDGTTLAVIGAPDGSTCLWDVAARRQTATLTVPSSSSVTDSYDASGGAFSPGGTMLAIADTNGSTYLWDVTTRRLVATLNNPDLGHYEDSGGVESVSFGPRGSLAVGDGDGNVYVWDVSTRRVTATLSPAINVLEANPLFYNPNADVNGEVAGGNGPIGVTVAFSHNGQVLAAGVDYGYGACLWNGAATGQIATVTDPRGNNSQAPGLALGPNGGTLAVVDHNGRVYLWRLS